MSLATFAYWFGVYLLALVVGAGACIGWEAADEKYQAPHRASAFGRRGARAGGIAVGAVLGSVVAGFLYLSVWVLMVVAGYPA